MVLLAALLLIPIEASASVPLQGTITSRGDAAVRGTLDATLYATVVRFDAFVDHGNANATFGVSGARLVIVDSPLLNVSSQGRGPYSGYRGQEALPDKVLQDIPVEGQLQAATTEPNGLIRILPRSDHYMAVPFHFSGPATIRRSLVPNNGDFVPSFEGRRLTSFDLVGSIQPDGLDHFSFTGDVEALMYGAVVNAPGLDPIHTGQYEETVLADPTNLNQAGIIHRVFAVLVADGAHIDIGSTGSTGWHYNAGEIRGRMWGMLSFDASAMDTSIDQTRINVNAGRAELGGVFNITTTYQPSEATWNIQGDADYVVLNAQTRIQFPHTKAALLIEGVGLAAIVAWIWRASIVGFHRASPFENRNRIRILQTIGENPGLIAADLVKATGLSRATVKHHLVILRKNNLLDVTRDGRHDHLLLNSHSYRFPVDVHPQTDGTKRVEAPAALVVLRQPIRRQLFEALIAQGRPLSYADYTDVWRTAGTAMVPRSLFDHHMAILCREGLAGQIEGRPIKWRARLDYAALLRTQAEKFLASGHRNTIMSMVADAEGSSLEQLERRLPQLETSALRRNLQELTAHGFLVQANDGNYAINRRGAFRFANMPGATK
jgi:predicted transcriptional regulator